MKYTLIILSLVLIYAANPFRSLTKKFRSLEGLTDLYFIEAKNLIFNTDSRWQFGIKYFAENQLQLNADFSTPILYNGKQSLASCTSQNDFILNCFANEKTQTKMDLIQINNENIEGATINWKNLTEAYDVPINTSLKYDNSYSLKYHVYGNSKYWDFKVKIKEDVLPAKSTVKIDIFFSDDLKLVATCKYETLFLNCEFNKTKPNTAFLIQISPTKSLGSIDWENLDSNATVPFDFAATNYYNAYDLELINNQWTYILSASSSSTSFGGKSSLITLNTKLTKKNGETKINFT